MHQLLSLSLYVWFFFCMYVVHVSIRMPMSINGFFAASRGGGQRRPCRSPNTCGGPQSQREIYRNKVCTCFIVVFDGVCCRVCRRVRRPVSLPSGRVTRRWCSTCRIRVAETRRWVSGTPHGHTPHNPCSAGMSRLLWLMRVYVYQLRTAVYGNDLGAVRALLASVRTIINCQDRRVRHTHTCIHSPSSYHIFLHAFWFANILWIQTLWHILVYHKSMFVNFSIHKNTQCTFFTVIFCISN